MKYMKRAGIYKANNVTFDPRTMDAYSYVWWRFVARIGGQVVFNTYYYSPSTSKHQSKVRSVLSDLGITVDIAAPFPQGIKTDNLKELILEAEENLCDKFLRDEAKKIERSEKAAQRRLLEKVKAIAIKHAEHSLHDLILNGQVAVVVE